MQAECFGPCEHRAGLQAVATTDDGLEVWDGLALLASGDFLLVQRGERIGDHDTGVWAEAVVVEVEVLEWDMRGEEGDEWCLHVETKSIVVQVDGVEVWKLKESSEEGRKGSWDLGEEATGEDVGKVGDLKVEMLVNASLSWAHSCYVRKHT